MSVIIQEAVKLLNATLPSSIEICVSLKTNEDVVVADSTEMHQVIMNLGTNAGHAMKSNGGKLEYILELAHVEASQAAALSLQPGDYVLPVRHCRSFAAPGVPSLPRLFRPKCESLSR